MKTWAFYWLTGQREALTGETATDALNRAGYSGPDLAALDFFAEGDADHGYAWNGRTWSRTESEIR